jgi:hypothetical protein
MFKLLGAGQIQKQNQKVAKNTIVKNVHAVHSSKFGEFEHRNLSMYFSMAGMSFHLCLIVKLLGAVHGQKKIQNWGKMFMCMLLMFIHEINHASG